MALSAFLVPALRLLLLLATARHRRASHSWPQLDAPPVLPSARGRDIAPRPAGQGGIREKEAEGKGVTGRSNLM